MEKITGIFKKAFGAIKDSFNVTLNELKTFIKAYVKEYKRLSRIEKMKKKTGEKGESSKSKKSKEKSSKSKKSKEKAEELKSKYAEWRQKIMESANISKLDPKKYQSTDELYLGILEVMGLNEDFKNNPKAKENLTELLSDYVLKDMAEENQEIEAILQKKFEDLTEEDVLCLKEKLTENQKLKIDEQGNLKYIETTKNDYEAIYKRKEFKLQGSDYIYEIFEKKCERFYDQIEDKYKGNEIIHLAGRKKFNKFGVEMSMETHRAIKEYASFIKDKDVWKYVNGESENIEDILEAENVVSQVMERYDVMGVSYTYKDKTTEPHISGNIKTMNDNDDLTYLNIDRKKMKAVQYGDTQKIEEYQKEMELNDEDKKTILKEKIENSSQKEALTRMGEQAGILDREEQRTQ